MLIQILRLLNPAFLWKNRKAVLIAAQASWEIWKIVRDKLIRRGKTTSKASESVEIKAKVSPEPKTPENGQDQS